MELILLPGNSKKNKKWIENVEFQIKNLFEKTRIYYYRHWKTGEEIIDIEYETKKLAEYLKNKKEYFILAKSIGTALAIKNIKEKRIFPKKCIFLGMPILWCRKHNIDLDSWIEDYSTSTLFIQNNHDPAIEANELKIYLEKKRIKNYQFIELEGNTHDYDNINQLKEFLQNFL